MIASTGPVTKAIAENVSSSWAHSQPLGVVLAVALFAWALVAENWRTIRELTPEHRASVEIRGRIAKEDEGVLRVPLTLRNMGHERIAFADGWTLRVLDASGAVTAEYQGRLKGDRLKPLEHLYFFDVDALFFHTPSRPPIGTPFEVVGTDVHGNVISARYSA